MHHTGLQLYFLSDKTHMRFSHTNPPPPPNGPVTVTWDTKESTLPIEPWRLAFREGEEQQPHMYAADIFKIGLQKYAVISVLHIGRQDALGAFFLPATTRIKLYVPG